jgi:hypothetical protein
MNSVNREAQQSNASQRTPTVDAVYAMSKQLQAKSIGIPFNQCFSPLKCVNLARNAIAGSENPNSGREPSCRDGNIAPPLQ